MTGAENNLEDVLAKPMVIVCNMFLDQLNALHSTYYRSLEKLPKRVINLRKNLENLVKQYEEDR